MRIIVRGRALGFFAGMAIFFCAAAPANAQQAGPIQPTAPASSVSATVSTTASATQSQAQSSAPVATPVVAIAPAPASGAKVSVPIGTHIPLVLHNAISTASAKPGDPVYFETLFPVLVDGKVVIPAGSYVSGEVTQAKRAGKVKGHAQLGVRLTTMILPNAYTVNLAAAPSNVGTGGHEKTNGEGTISGDSDKSSDVGTVIKTTATGVGVGAGIGAAAGIGAGAGAAAGLLGILMSRGPDAEMPRGTTLEAVLDRPIVLDADKVQFTTPGTSSTLAGPPNREPQRQKVPF